MTYAKVEPTPDGSLAFRSSYDRQLVDALKASIPYSDRRWDPDGKQWLVLPKHLPTLEKLAAQYLGCRLRQSQAAHQVQTQKETRVLKVEYIGAPKERTDGSVTAMGYSDGDWSVVFPQDVLKNWFELGGMPDEKPSQADTLYGLLGLRRDAGPRDVKKAFRNMAKRWHPDVSQEPDAAAMFRRINDAYEVLSDPQTRKKYDAGLALEASLDRDPRQRRHDLNAYGTSHWRPPLRCGHIMVEGRQQLGRFMVEQILGWTDITDARGRVLVTSWPAGADIFTKSWI